MTSGPRPFSSCEEPAELVARLIDRPDEVAPWREYAAW
jgi:hypothetical protein